jgi:hypothetical protein
VLGVIGLILMGVRARVPMWLQLPVFGSPRRYINGHPDEEHSQDGDHSKDGDPSSD